MIELKFHSRDRPGRSLPHHREGRSLANCLFENRLFEACFPVDCVDEGGLVEASVPPGRGREQA